MSSAALGCPLLKQKTRGYSDLATVVPGLPDQLRLPSIFLGPLAQRTLLPGIETAKAPPPEPPTTLWQFFSPSA
ncbi:hypothetical protein WSK_4052 [Novosphingobium sp. Rr 2-17]|nr:hypothetical protein WSK_4052 [Novosphingobium sp. Rr 2-17]